MISARPPGIDCPAALKLLKSASTSSDGCSCSWNDPLMLTLLPFAVACTETVAATALTFVVCAAASSIACCGVAGAADAGVVDPPEAELCDAVLPDTEQPAARMAIAPI